MENKEEIKLEFFKQFGNESFRGYPLEQCQSIWEFFNKHIQYQEDSYHKGYLQGREDMAFEILEDLEIHVVINEHDWCRNPQAQLRDFIESLNKQERKEIQPNDIWNKESQDKIKEHILNHANNQSSEAIIETELAAKKYAEEDMADISKVTRFEVIDENGRVCTRHNCNVELSYQDDGRTLKVFINSLNKQD